MSVVVDLSTEHEISSKKERDAQSYTIQYHAQHERDTFSKLLPIGSGAVIMKVARNDT